MNSRTAALSVTIDGAVLTVRVPEELEATPRPDGLTIRRHDAAAQRRIYEIAITLLAKRDNGGAADLAVPLDRVRGGGADAIHYSVTRDDGGSGGEEITLVADRACDSRIVHLRFDTQAEDGGEVDLEPAFVILESARCTPVTSRER